jgi:hypothetical protein
MLQDYFSDRHKKKRKNQRNFFLVIVISIVIAIAASAWWILFRSPVLKVRQVIVQGNDAVASSDVVALLDGVVLKEQGFTRSLFGTDNMLAWPNALTLSDLAADPRLASVTLEKDYLRHTVTAMITERKPLAIWCAIPKIDAALNPQGDELCYWFDVTGTMFQKAFDTEGSVLFAVHDYSQGNAALGGKILPDIFIPNLVSILSVLKQSGLSMKEVALTDISLQEIDVSTYNGPSVYFSLRFPAGEDLAVLQSLMAQSGFNVLQYVDFRVENRAYYK